MVRQGLFSDAVLAYLDARYGIKWPVLRSLTSPLRIGEVLILPITGFSPVCLRAHSSRIVELTRFWFHNEREEQKALTMHLSFFPLSFASPFVLLNRVVNPTSRPMDLTTSKHVSSTISEVHGRGCTIEGGCLVFMAFARLIEVINRVGSGAGGRRGCCTIDELLEQTRDA